MSQNIAEIPKPNYFEIFTKVLNELNWREVSDFDEIVKSEHKRILNLINIVNAEVLSSCIWDFLLERSIITLDMNQDTIFDNFDGKIISIFEGNKKYKFIPPAVFLRCKMNFANVYSNVENKIVTLPFEQPRELNVVYTRNLFARDASGKRKIKMEEKQDTSIIPASHIEPVLVYGTLIKVKANPSFAKFGYWRTLYFNALANLRTQSGASYENSPMITFG